MATATAIELQNIGPIEHLSIPIPESGGVVVLQGRNGRGKSRALEAVESAISGRGKVDVRDGALRGEVDAFGVTIKVGRSTRRSGELEVQSLEGRLAVAELVDPGLKSPEAADAKRIKALAQLSGIKPNVELFYPLLGDRERFDAIVSSAAVASEDLVVMADRIKRDIEAAARKEEDLAQHAEGRAQGSREAAAAVDMTAESDPAVLGAALEAAIRLESSLKEKAAGYTKAKRAADMARDQLEDQELSYSGPTAAQCREKEALETARLDATQKALRDAEEALRRAQASHEQARNDLAAAIQARKAAERHEALVAQFREQLQATLPSQVPEAELVEASQRVEAAREAVERGAIVRRAKEHAEAANEHGREAKQHRDRAAELRDAARGTDDVLSQIVSRAGSKLRVEAGRLVLDTRRGATYFADLSHGERWKLAIDIALDALGDRGVLVIPQESWEGCDDVARGEIATHAKTRGVIVLTAACSSDEEITARQFDA